MVGHLGVTDGTEEDDVVFGESVDAVVRHHLAVLKLVLGSPAEVGKGNVKAELVGGVLKQRTSASTTSGPIPSPRITATSGAMAVLGTGTNK